MKTYMCDINLTKKQIIDNYYSSYGIYIEVTKDIFEAFNEGDSVIFSMKFNHKNVGGTISYKSKYPRQSYTTDNSINVYSFNIKFNIEIEVICL